MSNYSRLEHRLRDEGYIRRLKGAPLSVYCILLTFTNYKFEPVFAKHQTLAELTGYSTRQVGRAINKISDEKLILVGPQITKNGQKCNQYFFLRVENVEKSSIDTHVQPASTPMSNPSIDTHVHPLIRNNNVIKQEQQQTIGPKLKRRIIQEEYETDEINLESAVVAILKNVGLDSNAWHLAKDIPIDRLRLLEKKALKANRNPAGLFRKSLEGNWEDPKDKADAFIITCDLIRASSTHLVSKKSRIPREILKSVKGPVIDIWIGHGKTHTIDNEKELGFYTQEKLTDEEAREMTEVSNIGVTEVRGTRNNVLNLDKVFSSSIIDSKAEEKAHKERLQSQKVAMNKKK